jgi:hypothetical protein
MKIKNSFASAGKKQNIGTITDCPQAGIAMIVGKRWFLKPEAGVGKKEAKK